MIDIVKGRGSADQRALRRVMHRDRKSVFVDMLGWDVPHDGESEADGFDDDHAVYLILRDPRSGIHLASLRLLSTERPHLMDTVFPQLCAREIPRGRHVREVSRFCVMPYGTALDRRVARNALVDAMLDHLTGEGVRHFTAVCYTRMLQQVLSAGWDCVPLGLPQDVDGRQAGALRIDIAADTKMLLEPEWQHVGRPIRSQMIRELAA